MFPQITRDDVFRIETPRLWLRWPDRRDAKAISSYASRFEVADMTASIPHPYPEGEADRFVDRVRESNGCGETLELMVARKSAPWDAIGTVLLRYVQDGTLVLGYALHPDHWGRGYATEAAKALVDAAFLLLGVDQITATVRSDNAASRHVLGKLGFMAAGQRSHFAPLRNAVQVVEDYRLPRQAYHAAFGGALHPLVWEAPYDWTEWAGAA